MITQPIIILELLKLPEILKIFVKINNNAPTFALPMDTVLLENVLALLDIDSMIAACSALLQNLFCKIQANIAALTNALLDTLLLMMDFVPNVTQVALLVPENPKPNVYHVLHPKLLLKVSVAV